ncbi:hypothetical protein QYM36_007654 [Artemia franciscana]|uniref:Uncharacterized protein n=1 Tax=Artemia franciscana TaxID=6661 RepID=A0AA88ISM7_ARTSF|nr:hypothetical protein QYM36_007654 [Artemia franciscana]
MQRLPFELTPSKKSRLLVNYSNGVIYQDVTKDSLCRVKNVVTLEKRALRLGSDHSADLATELEDVDRADNIYAAATQLREEFMDVFFRLETDHGCSINMVASDVQYHNVCLQQFIKTASAQPVKQTYEKCFLELANKDANKSY